MFLNICTLSQRDLCICQKRHQCISKDHINLSEVVHLMFLNICMYIYIDGYDRCVATLSRRVRGTLE